MKVLLGLVACILSLPLLAETTSQSIAVTVKTFESVAIDVVADAPAEVIVNNQPDISAEISAKVSSIAVLEGDVVAAGDLLLQLDCQKIALAKEIAQAALTQSNARLSFARSQLQRANNLKKKNSISDELLDQRSTELKEAIANQLTQKHNAEQADVDYANCRITAPFAALVSKRLVSEGSYVVPGTAVISLMRLNDAEVEAQLRQPEVKTLLTSKSIWLETDNKRYPLKLRTILPVYDALTKTSRAKLVFENGGDVWPGINSRLFWETDDRQLPAELMVRRDDQLGVFLVNDNRARFYPIENAIEGRSVKVELEPSVQIVDEGRHRLNDGERVTVMSNQ